MELDPDGPTPLYEQVAAILRGEIAAGLLRPGRPLPSAVTLVQDYGIARGTALHALRVLVEEGLAYVVPGKGTYVR
jgi:GntR family transcriptional regulator